MLVDALIDCPPIIPLEVMAPQEIDPVPREVTPSLSIDQFVEVIPPSYRTSTGIDSTTVATESAIGVPDVVGRSVNIKS